MLGPKRAAAVRRGEVRMQDIALGEAAWPAAITQIANSYRNQFELPVLFYTASALAITTATVDVVIVMLAWAFVISRYAHATIHITSNHVPSRFRAFVAGVAVLLILWIWLAVRLLMGGGLA